MQQQQSFRPYQMCSRCILDTNDYPEIKFDARGVCEVCLLYDDLYRRTVYSDFEGFRKLEALLNNIRNLHPDGEYDCAIALSGGVDSTYLTYKAKEWGLKPLVVHIDNGWNSELAVKNIETVLKRLNLELYTIVLNWNQLRDLQLAFFRSGIIDLDIPSEVAATAALFRAARRFGLKYILSGHNTVTEGILPPNFTSPYKYDTIAIRAINRRFGKGSISDLPMIGFFRFFFYTRILGIKFENPLNYIDYNKSCVKKFIMENLGWRDYGYKHYENIFTRFYQGYILPTKYHVDKRKSHFSTLICSGQMKREDALEEMKRPIYPTEDLLRADKQLFISKLGISEKEFEEIMKQPVRQHSDYPSYYRYYLALRPLWRVLKKLKFAAKPPKSASQQWIAEFQ